MPRLREDSPEIEPGKTQPHPLTEKGRKHGRVVSWFFVAAVIADFVVGGIALILTWWIVFFVCAGLFLLSPLAGLLVGVMQDTVEWALPPPRSERQRIDDVHHPGLPQAAGNRHEPSR